MLRRGLCLFLLCWCLVGGCAIVGSDDTGQSCLLSESEGGGVESTGESKLIRTSFTCSFPYCILKTSENPAPSKGHCTKLCEQAEDCPKGFVCEVFLKAPQFIPEEQKAAYAAVADKKLCVKEL